MRARVLLMVWPAQTAFAEHFQQPFVFDRLKFLSKFPNGQAKTLGKSWGRRAGLHVVKMMTNDGAEPSKVNYYLNRYPRREDALRWHPTGPMFDSGGTEQPFVKHTRVVCFLALDT